MSALNSYFNLIFSILYQDRREGTLWQAYRIQELEDAFRVKAKAVSENRDCCTPLRDWMRRAEDRYPPICSQDIDSDLTEDRWTFRHAKKQNEEELRCSGVRPSPKDVIRRFYAILPYFDKDHSNMAFLRKYRATVYGMSEGTDMLDREVSYYAAVITPLVFLQQYRDMWCLLERFHRAMRLYQISHPTEKRSALKLLQNFRSVNQKIRSFINDLPGPITSSNTHTSPQDGDDEEIHDKKDIRYLKELIKNLG